MVSTIAIPLGVLQLECRDQRKMETNTQRMETNTQRMETNTQRMETNTQRMETNTQRMETNTQRMETNTQRMETNTQRMETNTQRMETNTQRMETNTQRMGANTQRMETNTQRMETNAQRMETNTQINTEAQNKAAHQLLGGLLQTGSRWTTTGYVQMPERPVGTAASLPAVQLGGRVVARGVQRSQVLAFSRYFRGGRSQCHVEDRGHSQPEQPGEGGAEERLKQRAKNSFLYFLG